ncbi:hypothetical protein IWX85_002947 [Polaromonas sp. CG_9.11]|nr:hypothetical protein [Polaromonas sp. CG_9.11]
MYTARDVTLCIIDGNVEEGVRQLSDRNITILIYLI